MNNKYEKRKELLKKLEKVCNLIVLKNKKIRDYKHIDKYWRLSYKKTAFDFTYSDGLIYLAESVIIRNQKKLNNSRRHLIKLTGLKKDILNNLKKLK